MQLEREQSLEEKIQQLEQQVNELTTSNLLLQEQLARKEQFSAMIAHELRSPLSPIINYAQMIARQHYGEKNALVQRNTGIIISQARRLARLVNDLLDTSRLSSGQFSLTRESCNLVELAREVVEQLRPVAPYHTLELALPAAETAIQGKWDAGRIQQAIGNLLDNAIKYSDEGSTVTVCVWTTESSAHVSVHNYGAAIPSSDLSQLFRPYTRLPATSGRKGSGLGLFITKSIIEAHGGALRLEPPFEDEHSEQAKGTTFSFEIPL